MASSVIDAPDVTGLIELSRDPALDLKPVILRVQTDLFLAAPIRDRAVLASFASLATGLIPIVDDETALTVARKLAPCPDAPQAVLAALASRGGVICATVIDQAVVVGPTVLAAALSAGAEIAPALAARARRDRSSDTESGSDDLILARNPLARLDRTTLERLMVRGRREVDLAEALLGRQDVAAADLAPLWLHADAGRRQKIQDAIAATAALRPLPHPPRDIGIKLTGLSRGGDVKGFMAALAEAVGLPGTFLSGAPNPATRYDLLTLALRAADLSEAEAVYVFLTLNQTVARSADRVYALVQLYRSLTRPIARDLLGAILDVRLPERTSGGEHRPYYAPDSAKPRPAIERIASRNIVMPARVRQTV